MNTSNLLLALGVTVLGMAKKTLNQILADNLKTRMGEVWTQASLSAASKVAQTTISLYLSPDRRKASATGKAPSAKLSEVEKLAAALGCSPLSLLTDQASAPISLELLDLISSAPPDAQRRIEDVLRGALAMTTQVAPPRPALETKRKAA
jgi:hypothetical protein